MKQPLINPAYNFFRLDYWFGQVDSRPLALFRIVFALQLLKDAIYHLPLAAWFYSDQGVVPREAVWEMTGPNRFSFMDAMPHSWMAMLTFYLWIAVLLCLLAGWQTRLMAILNFVLILSIQVRNPYILNGADGVMRLLSFWMLFLPLGAHYSLDALLARTRRYARTRILDDLRAPVTPHTAFAFPLRMIQIQVMLVYIFATLLKLPGDAWLAGDALYIALRNETLALPTGTWFVNAAPSWLLTLMNYASLLIEGSLVVWLFAPLFQPALRAMGLLLGTAFHLGIGALMAIPNFSIVMIISYILFFDPAWLDALKRRPGPDHSGPINIGLPPVGHPAWLLIAMTSRRSVAVYRSMPWHEEHFEAILRRVGPPGVWAAWPPLRRVLGWLSACLIAAPLAADPPAEAPAPALPVHLRAAGHALLSTALGALMVGAIWWNLNTYQPDGQTPLVSSVQGPPRLVMQYLGLYQEWALFAPHPRRVYSRIAVLGRFEDGRSYDLITGQPLDQEAAAFWRWGPEARWRKFEENVHYSDDTDPLLRAWGRYYCHTHNTELALPEGQRLATLEIIAYERRVSLPGGRPNALEADRLWRHWCYPEYAY